MPSFTNTTQTQQSSAQPSNFFDYQKKKAGITVQPAQSAGTTYKPKTTQYKPTQPTSTGGTQPGSVVRPDGRPTPGEATTAPPPPVTTQPKDHSADIQEMMKSNPTMFPTEADARAWGSKYYGWGSPTDVTTMGGQAPVSTTPAGPTGSEYIQNLQPYEGQDFSQIESPLYNQQQYGITLPDMYDAYEAQKFDIGTPDMFSGYNKTDFSGIQTPEDYAGYNEYQYKTQLPGSDIGQYLFNRGDITQFTGPDQGETRGGLMSLMNHLLQNPTSMTDTGVAQMKEREKEQILQSQKAFEQQNAELMARRGMVGGGQDMAQQAALQNQAQKDLLSSYRDIDLKKMTQDFADKQSTASLADAILTGDMGRATQAYNALLAGQKAREEFTAESARSGQEKNRLERELARLGLDKEALQAKEGQFAFDARSKQFQDYLKKSQLQKDILDSSSLENLRQYESGRDIFDAGMDKSKFEFEQGKANADEGFRAWESKQNQFQDMLKALGLETQVAGMNQAENFKAYESQQDAAKNLLAALAAQEGSNQFAAGYAADNAKTLSDLAVGDATRNLQKYLAEKGFAIDESKIAQTGELGRMDDATRRYGINMDFLNSALNRNQSGSQFDRTMAFNTKGQENDFFKWLMGSGVV